MEEKDVIPFRIRANIMAVLICMMFILTGCWDRLEIEERAMILGVAIDKAPAKEIEKPRNITFIGQNVPETEAPALRITIQLAVPGRIPLGPSEGGGGSKGEKPVWVVSAVGHTIDDAFNVSSKKLHTDCSGGICG
jgi:spore germination protein KC